MKVVCAAFGMYALQMLFIPSKIVLDHFDTSFTPMIEFWVRGSAVGFMIAIAAILKLPTSDAHPLALLYSVACGKLSKVSCECVQWMHSPACDETDILQCCSQESSTRGTPNLVPCINTCVCQRQSLPCKHTRSSPCTCGNLESRALLLTLSFCGRDTGYLTSGLPVKYPMHYVPELLMLGLTVAGVLAY